jgi:DnaJ-class molecular chaperone
MSTLKVDNLLLQDNTKGTGRILEMFCGICVGQTFQVLSGTYTLENVTGVQNMTTTYTDITGSSITYTPPEGTKNVVYKFSFLHDRHDTNPLSHFRTYLDDDEIIYRRFSIGMPSSYGQMTTHVATFQCNASATDFNTGALTSWTTAKTIKMQGREWGSSNESKLHETHHFDGSTSDQFYAPSLEIMAIG